MQTKKNTRLLVFRIVFTILLLVLITAIFLFSAQSGTVSSGKSQAVMEFFNKILERIGFGFRFTQYRIRKLAHFSEYCLLGLLLMPTLRVYTQRYISHISWPLFVGLLVPVMDESLQMLIPGRSGQLTDVLIDFAGVFTGIVIGLFLLLLFRAFWDAVHGRAV